MRLILAALFALSLALPASLLPIFPTAQPVQAADCEFVLGFKAIRDLIPDRVGECKTNEYHNPVNGDGLQETTGGLLVWRKADNWTAFTDGYRTWVNGPQGLQQRLNTERFPWESDPIVQPTPVLPQPPVSRFPWQAELISWAPNCGTTWMWGNVYDRNGTLVDGISVKTWNDWGNELIITSGSDPVRGKGGWVRIVNNKDNPQTWYAAIVDGGGNVSSEVFIVRFDGDCEKGAQEVRINFHER